LKLIKQVKLFFQEGSSDKVYEIDLCEAGEGYIVNFRYGRRGAALKEGTKTIFPVELPEAEKVFAALEQEKRKKGYVAAGEAQVITSAEPKAKPGTDKRKKAILKILKTAAAGEEAEHWPLSRVIWRAGDLKIQEAIPVIIKLADPADTFNIYSVIWAIGRCGTTNALPFLQELRSKTSLPPFTQQLLTEVLLKYSEGAEKEALLQAALQVLPAPLRTNIEAKNYKAADKQIREYLFELKTASNEYLSALYQLSRQSPALHTIFLDILRDVPLKANYFKHVRHIFKTAEMLEDYATYGVIARNIEKKPAGYKSTQWMNADYKKNLAFSNKTKEYLTRRVLRFLQYYGKAGESSYTDLATDILLAFDDAHDLTAPYHTSDITYQYDATTRRNWRQEHLTHFDSYSAYQAFNTILYTNSTRYIRKNTAWACLPPYIPGQPAPAAREEAFPHLWDKAPDEIIQLLAYSNVERVHEFALKVFEANPGFENQVEMQHVLQFLLSPFVRTQQLGLTLARKKYDRTAPDKLLLKAMLDSDLAAAREQAEQWIAEQKATLVADTEFIGDLLLLRKGEAHAWLRGFLATVSFTQAQAEIIIAKAIAHLVTTNIETEEDKWLVNQLSDTLVIAFAANLRDISLDIVKDLFRHSATEIHTLAGKILMNHTVKPEALPEDFLQILLQSNNLNSRSIGVALLGRFPENILLTKKEILVSFCLSPLADVRNAVRPLIFRLTQTYPAFGTELVDLFVPAFLMKESYEGLHDDLLSLLANELSSSLHVISKERTLLLLNSKFKAAQQMGVVLLKQNIREEDLTVPELVKLGSNPLQEIRVYTWNIFRKYPDTIKAAKEEAIRITDSYWDDTRIFAFDFFRNTFTASDWTIELLVTLCDSVREDVQDFGREMITRFFDAQHGTDYLLKLSQHPHTKVQLFTTAYLEKYAGGNVHVIQTLRPYFVTLLSQVNKGKAAKARVMEFLRKEALAQEEVARIASEIFTRVSASVAITEKAACIAALRDIHHRYPAIQSPIVMKQHSEYIKS
jgi:predicted DNA-binding WGR domain protein